MTTLYEYQAETKKITIDYTLAANENVATELYGWNLAEPIIGIR